MLEISTFDPQERPSDIEAVQLLEMAISQLEEGTSISSAAPSIAAYTEIGDYEIIEELGRGGMGVVYKARQRSLNRIVALKMVLGANFAGQAQILRFQREAEVVASLSHPHIVTIHEINSHEGNPFYCMDFIEGRTLKEMIGGGPLPWEKAAEFAKVICNAMQFSHDRGVIHRDLKPQNIMVDRNGHLQVTDFGLARDLNAENGLTVTGAAFGTPNYMAPEQARGSKQLDGASDIYAIGAILYEMLTSIPPFVGASLGEILQKIQQTDPIAPILINPQMPRDLNTVCLKCLEKDPQKRYQTAAELEAELDRVLSDIPVLAKPIRPLGRAYRWSRRNRTLALVIVASTLIIVTGTILYMLELDNGRKEAEAARREAEMDRNVAEAARKKAETSEMETVAAKEQVDKALEDAKKETQRAEAAEAQEKLKEEEAEDNLKKYTEQKKIAETAQEDSKSEYERREKAEDSLFSVEKSKSELEYEHSRDMLSHRNFAEAYLQTKELLSTDPENVNLYQQLACIEMAAFNIPAAIHWLEQGEKYAPLTETDARILKLLHSYVEVWKDDSDPLSDRELQLALARDVGSINDPTFTFGVNYLQNSNPANLDERLQTVREH